MVGGMRGASVLFVAAVLIGSAWVLNPHSPPLYDGLVGPVGPYKYLNPPAGLGSQHGNPTSGQTTEKLTNGKFTVSFVRTKERVPQAILQLGDGAVVIPPGVSSVTLRVRPVPPPGPIRDGDLDGNVYLFTATSNDGRSLRLNPKVGGLLELRKTGQELSARVEQYEGGQWISRSTLGFVNANYLATDARSLGYYALVAPAGQSSFLSRYLPLIIAAVVILILVITALVAIRLTRRTALAEEVG